MKISYMFIMFYISLPLCSVCITFILLLTAYTFSTHSQPHTHIHKREHLHTSFFYIIQLCMHPSLIIIFAKGTLSGLWTTRKTVIAVIEHIVKVVRDAFTNM